MQRAAAAGRRRSRRRRRTPPPPAPAGGATRLSPRSQLLQPPRAAPVDTHGPSALGAKARYAIPPQPVSLVGGGGDAAPPASPAPGAAAATPPASPARGDRRRRSASRRRPAAAAARRRGGRGGSSAARRTAPPTLTFRCLAPAAGAPGSAPVATSALLGPAKTNVTAPCLPTSRDAPRDWLYAHTQSGRVRGAPAGAAAAAGEAFDAEVEEVRELLNDMRVPADAWPVAEGAPERQPRRSFVAPVLATPL